tara:strand:- start:242 stop:460 length:219 start_codon:yes stop_codon:yes gene_type:complete
MKLLSRVFVVTVLCFGVIFAKEKKNNLRIVVKKERVDLYWEKQQEQNDENQLERKRSHKRRRKIRKPIKGLR